ncbi:PDZ domain-containing protein 2-like [Neocloeon triangulifer]|uniref:PDZ domain-containing protein 2-like n=1 Tax=Neocloeon triangulifer TaxID=2078957 RepID=UPI00286F9E08|nr:PDZ domain-containing protein 2-like [Neocloeon triangulifer]
MRLFRRRLSDVSLSSPDKEDDWQMVKAVPALVLEDAPPKKGTVLSTWGRRVGRKLELLRRPETPSSRPSTSPATPLFRSCSTSQLSYVRGDDPAEDLIQTPPPVPSKTLSCDNLSQIGRRFPYAFLRSSRLASLPEEPGARQMPRCRPHSITSFEVPSTESGYDSDRPSSEESNSGGRCRTSLCEPRIMERCAAPRFGSYRMPCRPPNGPELKMIRLIRAAGLQALGIHAAPRRQLALSSALSVGDGYFVTKLEAGGVAQRDGRLRPGDEIVSVNGALLRGLPVREAQRILSAAGSAQVELVISRSPPTSHPATFTPRLTPATSLTSIHSQIATSLLEVKFQKGPGHKSLGFSIVGGRDSPKGDIGVFVKSVFPDGQAAENHKLLEGDEILAVNGEVVSGLSHAEAIGLFKRVKSGEICLRIARRGPRTPS